MVKMPYDKDNVFFVVVIYNKECIESPSVQYALRNSRDLSLLVIDNSTIETNNKVYCHNNSIAYVKMKGNAGLSRAYNCAIEYIFDRSEQGLVIWADDDTEFPDDYLFKIEEAFKKNAPSVVLPLVMSQSRIYSPNIIDNKGFPQRVSELNSIKGQLSGINSGMAVDLAVYNTYRYDETIFLDFIDHDFCTYCNKSGLKILFLEDLVLMQNSFFASKLIINKVVSRRKNYRKDFIKYCKKNKLSLFEARRKIFNGEVSLFIRYIKQSIYNKD